MWIFYELVAGDGEFCCCFSFAGAAAWAMKLVL